MEDRRESSASKRKASPERASDQDDGSPKRLKRQASPEPRRSPTQDRRDSAPRTGLEDAVRGASASQEERKRGKRLFGGLLSTLSQTTTNSHQRRRVDIERRQLERQQRQKEEDAHRKNENSARFHEIRVKEQVVFEDKVMRQKHSKMLWAAQHLKTKADPPVFYSPWKLTERQKSVVETQTQAAKDRIQSERDAFENSDRRKSEQHIPLRFSPPLPTSQVKPRNSSTSS